MCHFVDIPEVRGRQFMSMPKRTQYLIIYRKARADSIEKALWLFNIDFAEPYIIFYKYNEKIRHTD